jgi:flagellar biosynthesis GTPase FlhF
MELKRILARDSRSANEKAIQLYGVDVLIISSQRLDNQTELIVAVDLDKSPAAPLADVADVNKQPAEKAAAESDFVPFSKLFQSASAFAPLPSDERPVVMPQAVTSVQVSAPLPVPDLAPAAPAAAVTRDADAAQTRHDSQRSQEIVEMMRQEMAALRKEFSLSRQMMPWQDGLRLSPEVQQLSLAMSEAGMPAGLRALLTDSIQSLGSVQEALPVMHSLLVNALSRPAMAVPHTGVHALCGPSGAGKTSMVGRLALAAALAHGAEQQAMVSFADQRPGAWAQMQLLAAQSGVACYRAANTDMLQTLLEDLEGKTVWIDTCGTDFLAQAALLMKRHPKVLRHAVLPVDATVTSVQKILQNSNTPWSSLMLSKVDEAAYPWALIKGLSEQSLSVSCMAGDSRIAQEAISFDADLLVKLALAPLAPDLGAMPCATTVSTPVLVQPVESAWADKNLPEAVMPIHHEEDIVIPTLMGAVPALPARKIAADASRVMKVAHG